MTTIITFTIREPLTTYNHSRSEIDRAIGRAFAYYERHANVDLKIIPSGGLYTIGSQTLWVPQLGKGAHARGQYFPS